MGDVPPDFAAVLAPVFRDPDGELRIVLVIRSDHGRHGGQLGLPGGREEPDDADLLATALREAEEEIGLARSDVEVLAELPSFQTHVSNLRVQPYLGRIPASVHWQLQTSEVVGLLTPTVALLADPEARQTLPFTPPAASEPWLVDGILVDDHVLWGMTLRILDELVPRLVAGEWEL
jgi:8-oxo-dGTP pyrophosphatase MutT (NUDIX family)